MKISLTNPSVFGVKTQKFPPAAAKFCPKTKFKEPKITKFWKSALRHTAGGIDAERKLTFLCPKQRNFYFVYLCLTQGWDIRNRLRKASSLADFGVGQMWIGWAMRVSSGWAESSLFAEMLKNRFWELLSKERFLKLAPKFWTEIVHKTKIFRRRRSDNF